MRAIIKKYRWDIVAVIILLIVAGVPRLLDLGAFLTADEKNWIGRSYEFIRAFKDWRFNDMLQTTHPGVTTMWLTGLAVTAKMFVSHIPFSFQNLAHFVVAAQLPIALANTLAVGGMYIFLRALFTPSRVGWIPLLASLFIALDPFLIGYSRVAHVDALLASLLFLACLAAIIYTQKNYSQHWLIASAVLAALAMLTKVPGVFALPFLLLAILVSNPKIFWQPAELKNRLRDVILWGIIVALLFVIIWPAMIWVPDPKGNVLVLKRDLAVATLTPHHMTEDYTLNPWHYPAAVLARTSPVTLIFSGVLLIWLVLQFSIYNFQFSDKTKISNEPNYKTYWLLIAYIFFFILMMTLGAKKGDRYILPIWPAVDVLAAVGVSLIVLKIESLKIHWKLKIVNWKLAPHLILSIVAISYLVFIVARLHPYEIAYSNPLFPDNLSQELGWGEGLDHVATWLNEQAPNATVASWYPEELGVYTTAHVAHINAHEQNKVQYIVLYRNMFGRAPDHPANDFIDEYYKKRQPVFVAQVAGKEFAWVYEKWVFEGVVGELLPGKIVRQEIPVDYPQLAAIDILPATYLGKAHSGRLLVTLQDAAGQPLAAWPTPVASLEDNLWLTLPLPAPLDLVGQSVTVSVRAEGTAPEDAPTIRSTNQSPVGRSLAIRARYSISPGQTATEEETKLLRRQE